jgi:ABC-2 type transport system permease protein
MTKRWLVAVYEYQRNVFKKSFIMALLSVPLMIAVNVGVGLLLESLRNDNSPVGYVDHAGLFADPIPVPVSGSKEPVDFVSFQTEGEARRALESKEIQVYFVVAADYATSARVDMVHVDDPGRNAIRQFYDFIQINLLADHPPDIARRAALLGDQVTVRSLDGSRELPGGGPTFGLIMPLLISIAFLVLMMMSSGYMMDAVAEEKENRTMEVLMTTISPSQFIGGKVMGIVAVSFTQLLVWVAVSVLGVAIARHAGIDWFQNPDLDWGAVMASVAVGIPAFVLASALMTAIGAMVTSSPEGQSIGFIFFMLHFTLPTMTIIAIINSPTSPLPTVLSFLPFTGLMTISFRNMFSVVPAWQVAVSAGVQALCALGALWLAGRAFRRGMLRYGQRLSWGELLKGVSR